MLTMPNSGDKVFKVAIYNQEVRALVKENQSHVLFEDHWADAQVCAIGARDEAEARQRVAERYPPTDGFVVAAVSVDGEHYGVG